MRKDETADLRFKHSNLWRQVEFVWRVAAFVEYLEGFLTWKYIELSISVGV